MCCVEVGVVGNSAIAVLPAVKSRRQSHASNTRYPYSYSDLYAWPVLLNPFAALGRLTDQNIDKHLSSYAKSGIDLIIMERQP